MPEWLRWVWDAFFILTSTRPLTMSGPGPIPWTAVNEYGIRYEIEGDEFDRFVQLVQAMDQAYLQHQHAGAEGSKS